MVKDDKVIEIINKLPEKTRKLLDNPLMDAPAWSREWDNWAMDCLEQMNFDRDDGFITKEEWFYLHKHCFHDVNTLGHPTDSHFIDFYFASFFMDDKNEQERE